jgi:hypothetical protein
MKFKHYLIEAKGDTAKDFMTKAQKRKDQKAFAYWKSIEHNKHYNKPKNIDNVKTSHNTANYINLKPDEVSCFDMPEETAEQIIDKISKMASSIRSDWSDPRSECREIWRLCDLLKTKIALNI